MVFDAGTHTWMLMYVLLELQMSYHFNMGNILIAQSDGVVITDKDSDHGNGRYERLVKWANGLLAMLKPERMMELKGET